MFLFKEFYKLYFNNIHPFLFWIFLNIYIFILYIFYLVEIQIHILATVVSVHKIYPYKRDIEMLGG